MLPLGAWGCPGPWVHCSEDVIWPVNRLGSVCFGSLGSLGCGTASVCLPLQEDVLTSPSPGLAKQEFLFLTAVPDTGGRQEAHLPEELKVSMARPCLR